MAKAGRKGGGVLWAFVWIFWLSGVGLWPGSEPVSEWGQHWAFRKPVEPRLPVVRNEDWVQNPIDAFILARLEAGGLAPSPEADKRTLIRRLSLDLVGMTPVLEEVERFVSDRDSGAYERLVDRLLASPHFGERWGRHWLDLARYADSDGYEKDTVRPYAYLFRDWVIGAINKDLPFDQFTTEQLAGDLLPGASEDQKVATGFHRQTLTNKEGGVDQEEFRCKAIVDRVSTTGGVWLGLTIGCAECHNHKYDPISQREFYQLYAFFNDADDRELPLPTREEIAAYESAKERWETEEATLAKALEALEQREIEVPGSDTDEARKQLGERLKAHRQKKPLFAPTRAAVLMASEGSRRTRVHVRGDFLRLGEEVEPGTPAVLPRLEKRGLRADRLDLARWLFSEENPLTGRVLVNRVWGRLFGRGLVEPMNDFGVRGQAPSHPELLDWLAIEFRRLGWSRKRLIKLMVMSSTYRQGSSVCAEGVECDVMNRLLWRQNRLRLEAEVVRDASLAASGLLEGKVGGPSIRPPMPADIAAIGYANSIKWKESAGSEKYRRGLYIFFQRTVPYPMLMTFDAPDSNVTCTRRERSNTPLQALTLLNDPVFFECAQALGRSVAAVPGLGRGERIGWLFDRCLGRRPSAEELSRLQQLYLESASTLEKEPTMALAIAGGSKGGSLSAVETGTWVAVARAVLNLDEFITRE